MTINDLTTYFQFAINATKEDNWITSATDMGAGVIRFATIYGSDIVKGDFVNLLYCGDLSGYELLVTNSGSGWFEVTFKNEITIVILGKVTTNKPILHIGTWESANTLRNNLRTTKYPFIFIPESEVVINAIKRSEYTVANEIIIGNIFVLNKSVWTDSEVNLQTICDTMGTLFETIITAFKHKYSFLLSSFSNYIFEIHKRFGKDFATIPFSENTSGVQIKNITMILSNDSPQPKRFTKVGSNTPPN